MKRDYGEINGDLQFLTGVGGMDRQWDDTLWEFGDEMDPRTDEEMREWYG